MSKVRKGLSLISRTKARFTDLVYLIVSCNDSRVLVSEGSEIVKSVPFLIQKDPYIMHVEEGTEFT